MQGNLCIATRAVNQDFANADPNDFSSELNRTFDTSLLTPTEGIPDCNARAIAIINYVVRVLQLMICESSMYRNNLMWDQKYQSSRLEFAMIPASKDTNVLQCDLEEGPVWQMEDNEYAPVFCSLQRPAQSQCDDRVVAHPAA